LSELGARNPLLTVIAVWRNPIAVFWQMPLLILCCSLFYIIGSGYWDHYFPIDVPRGFVSQAGYELLHAIAFAPLVMAVIQIIARKSKRQSDIWSVTAISVGVLIAGREIIILAITSSRHALRSLAFDHFVPVLPYDNGRFMLFYQVTALIGLIQELAIFLISVRLILLLPISGLERKGWIPTLTRAWRDMRGSYVFALAVSIAAALPMAVADRFLYRLYRTLNTENKMAVTLTLRQWEALLVRSGQLTLDYLLVAALATTLYLTIEARTKSTAP